LSFEVYPGGEGVTEIELTDDHRQLKFTTTVDDQHLRIEGGPLDYAPQVRVHRHDGQPVDGRLAETIDFS
jgi:hypothetical protein